MSRRGRRQGAERRELEHASGKLLSLLKALGPVGAIDADWYSRPGHALGLGIAIGIGMAATAPVEPVAAIVFLALGIGRAQQQYLDHAGSAVKEPLFAIIGFCAGFGGGYLAMHPELLEQSLSLLISSPF